MGQIKTKQPLMSSPSSVRHRKMLQYRSYANAPQTKNADIGERMQYVSPTQTLNISVPRLMKIKEAYGGEDESGTPIIFTRVIPSYGLLSVYASTCVLTAGLSHYDCSITIKRNEFKKIGWRSVSDVVINIKRMKLSVEHFFFPRSPHLAVGLHPGGGVDGVTEETVARQLEAHHPSSHRPHVDTCRRGKLRHRHEAQIERLSHQHGDSIGHWGANLSQQ